MEGKHRTCRGVNRCKMTNRCVKELVDFINVFRILGGTYAEGV
jgi:hypothetical protein